MHGRLNLDLEEKREEKDSERLFVDWTMQQYDPDRTQRQSRLIGMIDQGH